MSFTRGLRHLALRVTDLKRCRAFYQDLFGMHEVWQPDADNLYVSSGVDNLALHQVPASEVEACRRSGGQRLDHFGFLMDSPESVDRFFARVEHDLERYGGKLVQRPKRHRDDSYSFYLSDPDGNVVQVLYEPTISAIEFISREQD